MDTFLATKGNTSSGDIFWLTAAIRKKERSGPGIVTVASAESARTESEGLGVAAAAGGPPAFAPFDREVADS